ncbi:MAG: VCBS repeat-containing protein [Lentisphaerae bacterium]|nr:VCBS repeat-containing protein [Lentisphaerota bacterium]
MKTQVYWLCLLLLGAFLPPASNAVILAPNVIAWGGPGFTPVVGDYDGDGADDLALYYQNTGGWYIQSADGYVIAWATTWGGSGYSPMAGDFDGDGFSDLAVYNDATMNWFVLSLEKNNILFFNDNWGWPDAIPVPGDFNGDGRTELTVYDASAGRWYLMPESINETADLDELAGMYSNAVADAAETLPSEIFRHLTAITTNNPNLRFRENPASGALEVKMASFMSADTATNYYREGQLTSMKYATAWVTVAPELKIFCQTYTGTNLTLRLKQLLGLPATSENDTIVEYWVSVDALVRPSPDPEITDAEAGLEFRTRDPFTSLSTNYIAWYSDNFNSSNYGMTNGVWSGFPWTRLGYTYDWALPQCSPVGLSEFVLPGRTLWTTESRDVTVDVVLVSPAADYAAAPDRLQIESRDGEIVVNEVPPEWPDR